MVVFEDYPREFSKMFWPSFNFLFRVNMKFWFQDERWLTKYWRFIYIAPTILLFIGLLIIDVFRMLKRGNIPEIAYRLPPFLVSFQAVLKFVLLFPKSTQITDIIKELGALWRTTGLNDKQLKDRHTLLKRVNFCNSATYWVTLIGTFHYLITPLIEVIFYKFILHQDSKLLLPIIAYSYPFHPEENWIVYIAGYAFQMYGLYNCVFIYSGTEMLMTTLCSLISMEFIMLCEDILSLKPVSETGNNVGSVRTNGVYTIKDIVKQHQKLISLSSQLNNVFNKMIFVNLLFVAGTTCFFKYSAQFSQGLSHTLSSYMGVLTLLINVFYLCYYGELLTNSSLRIGEVTYESLWYKEDKHYQRIVFMIIKRSQNACCLTSMRYAPITLNMFTKVISTTCSYISLMNSIYDDE